MPGKSSLSVFVLPPSGVVGFSTFCLSFSGSPFIDLYTRADVTAISAVIITNLVGVRIVLLFFDSDDGASLIKEFVTGAYVTTAFNFVNDAMVLFLAFSVVSL